MLVLRISLNVCASPATRVPMAELLVNLVSLDNTNRQLATVLVCHVLLIHTVPLAPHPSWTVFVMLGSMDNLVAHVVHVLLVTIVMLPVNRNVRLVLVDRLVRHRARISPTVSVHLGLPVLMVKDVRLVP
jgi:hypothetical protein